MFLVNGVYYKPESNITLPRSTDIYCVSDANPEVQCAIPTPNCGGNGGGEDGGLINCFMMRYAVFLVVYKMLLMARRWITVPQNYYIRFYKLQWKDNVLYHRAKFF